jgi:hypothetical protein
MERRYRKPAYSQLGNQLAKELAKELGKSTAGTNRRGMFRVLVSYV